MSAGLVKALRNWAKEAAAHAPRHEHETLQSLAADRIEQLEAQLFEALKAVKAEREECAKQAQAFVNEAGEPWLEEDIAQAIRDHR